MTLVASGKRERSMINGFGARGLDRLYRWVYASNEHFAKEHFYE